MTLRSFVVITTINSPNEAIEKIAKGCSEYGFHFIAIGDTKSPKNFEVNGCSFYGIEAQVESGLSFAKVCPTQHYSRKNIGYLLAMQEGADVIIETDDDNIPLKSFWDKRSISVNAINLEANGWVNVYRFFSDKIIWPRGFPLNQIQKPLPKLEVDSIRNIFCPIQQGLADENPDVDAIYRLVNQLPINFNKAEPIHLGLGTWCPFNSQNTTWWPDAFPLLYLPSCCSFRMTDIWRSLIAQRIAWSNGWGILFHNATVYQNRNEHDLMHDFQDELPGYLCNQKIAEVLEDLPLAQGVSAIHDNLRLCYRTMIKLGFIDSNELDLLELWLHDITTILHLKSNHPRDTK